MTNRIRDITITRGAQLGMSFHSQVPPTPTAEQMHPRTQSVICGRALGLFAALCVCFEETRQRARAADLVIAWLRSHSLEDFLTEGERIFLSNGGKNRSFALELGLQVESLLGLCWSVNLAEMDITRSVSDDFGSIFPNIEKNSPPTVFTSGAILRPKLEMVSELDFYTCTQWLHREFARKRTKWSYRIDIETVRARRLALEWVLSEDDWEDISLDT